MKKYSGAVLALSIVAAALSAAALVIGIIALVKSMKNGRITEGEYDFYGAMDEKGGYESDPDDENIGSDTLAF